MEVITPPCGVTEVINQFFNYDNLQKYLEYLLHLDKRAIEQIYQLRVRLDQFTELKQDIIDIKFKLEVNDKKFDDMNSVLNNHQLKLIECERQVTRFEEKISVLERENYEVRKKMPVMEENLTNLNKITDENCKTIDRLNTTSSGIKNVLEIHSSALDLHEKSFLIINKELHKLMNLEDIFVLFKNKSKKKFEKLKKKDFELNNLNATLQNKTEEMESNVAQLTESVMELSKNVSSLPSGPRILTKSDNNLDNIKNNPMVSLDGIVTPITQGVPGRTRDPAYQAFFSDYQEHKQRFEKLLKKFHELKKSLETKPSEAENVSVSLKYDMIENENTNNVNPNPAKEVNNISTTNILVENQTTSNTTTGGNTTQIMKMINVLTENQRFINSNMALKASKDEHEASQKSWNIELDRFKGIIGEALSKLDLKMKGNNEGVITRSIEKDEIEYGREIISSEITASIVLEIKENETIKTQLIRTETNSDAINKLYESIVDIRRQTLEEKKPDPRFSDKDFKALDIRVEDLDSALKYLRSMFEENFKGLEEEEDSDNSGLNLKDLIRSIKAEIRVMSDKIEKLIGKQENLGSDLLGKIRKDLSGESIRLLDEFKNDLRNSIGKIDVQLQSKVDHILLDDFGKKIDNRLQTEISKKIDKMDLKKNNNLITKKIDNLENKISKTLVDTLIDLQLEDAPLIVKKGILGDKCGSCNQNLNNSVQGNSLTSGYTSKKKNQNNDDNTRHQLRKIQDNSYKYGTGSYSRVLGHVNPNTINEELQLRNSHSKNYINTSVHLPEINNSTISYRKGMGETPNHRKKEWSLNNEDNKDLSVGNGLTEEFDKKIVKADQLIKASIKYYDNIEKKK